MEDRVHMTMGRKRLVRIITLLLIGMLLFIWKNSVESQAVSAARSGMVREWLEPFLEHFVGKGNVTDHLVRKLAHFAEYALYGALLGAWLLAARRWKWRNVLYCLLIGLCTAGIDETIQIFTGRGPMVRDVLLDFSGVCCGVGTVWLVVLLAEGMRKRD